MLFTEQELADWKKRLKGQFRVFVITGQMSKMSGDQPYAVTQSQSIVSGRNIERAIEVYLEKEKIIRACMQNEMRSCATVVLAATEMAPDGLMLPNVNLSYGFKRDRTTTYERHVFRCAHRGTVKDTTVFNTDKEGLS